MWAQQNSLLPIASSSANVVIDCVFKKLGMGLPKISGTEMLLIHKKSSLLFTRYRVRWYLVLRTAYSVHFKLHTNTRVSLTFSNSFYSEFRGARSDLVAFRLLVVD